MPVYSFITTIVAPDLEAAREAKAEMAISIDEAITAGDVPDGVTVEPGDLVEGDPLGDILTSARANDGDALANAINAAAALAGQLPPPKGEPA